MHRYTVGDNYIVHRLLAINTVADRLPWIFYTIITNGKITAAAFIGFYLILVSLWFPFWLLTYLITEWGVYAAAVGFVFLVGRSIIRMIAFPGASRKVTTDIEVEVAKYAVRMITTAATSLIDLSMVLDPPGEEKQQLDNRTLYQLPGLWNRVKSYRDRVLGVFADVLAYLYLQDSTSSLELSISGSSNQNGTTLNGNHGFGPGLTRYGNNQLSGDIGDPNALTTKARLDGKELLDRLRRVLQLLDDLESNTKEVLEGAPKSRLTEVGRGVAGQLRTAANELRDYVASLKPPSTDDNSNNSNGDEVSQGDDPTDSVRRKLEEQKNNPVEVAKAAIGSILPMLDPPPHTSIFGLDFQRGCMLSRYRGSRQFWVRRPLGGMVDVLHFPAACRRDSTPNQNPAVRNTKAVLYCNPNAGLVEVAAGLSLSGGNVPTADPDNSHDDSWVDFYTELGYDVYIFNYAGYGRSFGTTLCVRGRSGEGDQNTGCLWRCGRIIRSSLCTFQPTPDTLRGDGIAVAQHLLVEQGIEKLVIHGESIGGIAASGTAKYLSQTAMRDKLNLLICDRTFCNLEAIAQRLVGGWTGYAIRALTPFWNTDVTGDYLAVSCPKIVASDAADVIISEASSLKSGVALWKELHRGIATTKGIGWIPETPLQYRMADWENSCVNDTRYVASSSIFRAQPPVWPRDKHISFEEAFHFAACCKRIGKLAKSASRTSQQMQEQIPFNQQPLATQAWITLACCDGLTGATLGVATKRGFDATVTWLCSCLVFGCQVLVERAEKRLQGQQVSTAQIEVTDMDFDGRPPGYEIQEQEDGVFFPAPIPVVLARVVSYMETGDEMMAQLSHEFQFVVGVLHYIQSRLLTPATVQVAQRSRNLQGYVEAVGLFLNLHCGHNNSFSMDEKHHLEMLLERASTTANEVV